MAKSVRQEAGISKISKKLRLPSGSVTNYSGYATSFKRTVGIAEMLDAIDYLEDDNEFWISPEIEKALREGLLSPAAD